MSLLSSNIIEAIKMAKDRLLNKFDVRFDDSYEFVLTKAVSFAWRLLIHLVRDIHQSLHSTAYCLKEFPHGDEGGNYLKIKYSRIR